MTKIVWSSMNDETTLCRCRDCGAEFSDEDTVPMQIQPGADVERGCPKCHSDWWEYVRD